MENVNCLILNIHVSIHIDLIKLQSLFLNLREGSDSYLTCSTHLKCMGKMNS